MNKRVKEAKTKKGIFIVMANEKLKRKSEIELQIKKKMINKYDIRKILIYK
jgi:hypothetical protein